MIGTKDGGKTWATLTFNDSCVECDAKTSDAVYRASDGGAFHTLGNLNITTGTRSNVTGLASLTSTRFFVQADGSFGRALTGSPASISDIPNLRMFAPGSGGYVTLDDGSMVGICKSVLATGSGRLSCVAYRSVDGGFTWKFASVVASTAEVPYAVEGPSESALAVLANGTLMAVMRVQGEQGHYSPYVSKLSDDGGLSWHSLRPLNGSSDGEGVNGPGCVRPRLMPMGSRKEKTA
eukprot:g2817.t1